MSSIPPSTGALRADSDQGTPPRLALAPAPAPDWMADAVVAGGGHVVPIDEAEGLVWSEYRSAEPLAALLAGAPNIRWVQLPSAGIEVFADMFDDGRLWTCAKGVFAEPVAELALAMALTGMRGVGHYARQRTWSGPVGRNLIGANVTILGGGGITESLLRLLQPFDCRITVVRNSDVAMDGADEVLEADRYIDALADADLVVLALALTPDTEGMLSRNEFELMRSTAWIVNVARGRHIVTEDLVWALEHGVIGGAVLDVTDPEPLPDDHPLWSMPNCIITPHVGNTPEMGVPLLSERITTNVRRFAAGESLVGHIDAQRGY
ncbi:MAG: D-isomer specific 2-hydroxyacid dehydrogenase family protein [Ilumatobacteraceae bacterium]